MAHTTPAQQFGYLALTDADDEGRILVKAYKIAGIHNRVSTDEDDNEYSFTIIRIADEVDFYVKETLEQILDQLESIHPHMR